MLFTWIFILNWGITQALTMGGVAQAQTHTAVTLEMMATSTASDMFGTTTDPMLRLGGYKLKRGATTMAKVTGFTPGERVTLWSGLRKNTLAVADATGTATFPAVALPQGGVSVEVVAYGASSHLRASRIVKLTR